MRTPARIPGEGRRGGRTQLAAVVAAAIVASLVTVLVQELLRRESEPHAAVARPAAAARPEATPAPPAELVHTEPLVADDSARRAEVDRRLSVLETRIEAMSVRQPVVSEAVGEDPEDLWRQRVRDVVEEELERRNTAARNEAEIEGRDAVEREIRTQVAWMRSEHDLTPYEEEEVRDLLLEMIRIQTDLQERIAREEIEPEDYVRESEAFEAWMREQAIRVLGAGRAEEIFGL